MYQEILKKAGLTGVQAEIYDFLLGHSNWKASDIAREIKRPRGVVYKGLDELIALGLAQKKEDENMVTRFLAEHPSHLELVFARQEDMLKESRRSLKDNLPGLVSSYNLTNNKPGVRFFEGPNGVWQVLNDTLKTRTEILTILDVEAVDKYLMDVNREYVAKRNRLGIKKRILALDSEFTRERYKNLGEMTDVKLVKLAISPFSTSIQIYDNKIAYITMTGEYLFSTIIEDPHIYSMTKALFESIWNAN